MNDINLLYLSISKYNDTSLLSIQSSKFNLKNRLTDKIKRLPNSPYSLKLNTSKVLIRKRAMIRMKTTIGLNENQRVLNNAFGPKKKVYICNAILYPH